MENYFTDSLLYEYINKVAKEPLPNDINSDNEADSESEEDMPTFSAMEPIVAYLNDPNCNDFAENNGEWVLNENVTFDYSLHFDDVPNSIDSSFLHMPYLRQGWHACK